MHCTFYPSKVRACASMLLFCVALSACSLLFPEPPPKPHAKAKPRYSASDYVENLSQAHLILASDSAEIPTANLDIVNAFNQQRKTPPERVNILLIVYKPSDVKKTQQAIAPVPTPSENNNFPGLLNVMKTVDQTPNTLQNIHVFSATVAPARKKQPPSADAAQVRQTVEQQQQRILQSTAKLSTLEDVQVQLQLIDFFITHRFRDAAYLSVDNVKQALAKATENNTIDTDTLSSLSQQLETLESQLHQTLPYTLSMLAIPLAA